MNGPLFAEHVDTLKQEIRNAMEGPLRRFTERTGVSPKDIRFTMVDVTVAGDKVRVYALSSVHVEFSL